MARKATNHGITSAEYAQLGRATPLELMKTYQPGSAARDILRQLDEANKAAMAAAIAGRAAGADAGADAPPLANRGGKSESGSDYVQLVLADGQVKQVLKRRGFGGTTAFIDWLNFTIGTETFDDDDCKISDSTVVHESEKLVPITNEQFVTCLSRRLKSIFGYGVSHNLGYGQHFYAETYALPEDWGRVSIGGQRGTILVSISGSGLAAAESGWEVRLKAFLHSASRSRLTRVDLAHDFFNDSVHGPAAPYRNAGYSVDRADADHSDGLFNCGGRNPDCEHRGNWKTPNGKGRTITVGSRKNGKYARVYEKGKQLGDVNSPWVRVEVELKAVEYVIPLDILVRPGEFLAAQYPAFAFISHHQERIKATQRQTEISVDRAIKVVKHQFGAYIHHLSEIFGVEKFVEMVRRDDSVPAFMKVPHFGLAGPAIHEVRYPKPPVNLYAAASAW